MLEAAIAQNSPSQPGSQMQTWKDDFKFFEFIYSAVWSAIVDWVSMAIANVAH